MKFDVFDQKTESFSTKVEIEDIYSNDSVLKALHDQQIIQGKNFKVVRVHPELIIQQYDDENEYWVPLCWVVSREDETVEKKLVYRLENSEGLGPYSSRKGLHYLCSLNLKERGPSPENDHFPNEAMEFLDSKKAYCAFLSVDQLKSWFSDEDIAELEKVGFSIVEKQAKKIWLGGHQVLYIP
jgi:hypothetical protein